MKQLVILLTLFICPLFYPEAWADDDCITVNLTHESSDSEPDNEDVGKKGEDRCLCR